MLQINLLPWRKQQAIKQRYCLIILSTSYLLMVFLIYCLLNRFLQDKQQKLNIAWQHHLHRSQHQQHYIELLKKNQTQLNKLIYINKNRKIMQKKMERNHLILHHIGQVITPNIWLTNLMLTPITLTIEGETCSYDEVYQFHQNLVKQSYLSTLSLKKIDRIPTMESHSWPVFTFSLIGFWYDTLD